MYLNDLNTNFFFANIHTTYFTQLEGQYDTIFII